MSTADAETGRRPSTKDLTGQVFGLLTVQAFAGYLEHEGHRRPAWDCRCACGRTVQVAAPKLIQGKTRSCGCGRSGRSAAPTTVATLGARRPTAREEAARRALLDHAEARRRAKGAEIEMPTPWMA